MKYLIVLLFSLNLYAVDMSMAYRSYDGQLNYECDVKLVHDLAKLYDVYCFDENNILKKKFGATIRVSKQVRSRIPENTLEIIFRVSQKLGGNKVQHTGATSWINLEKDSGLHSMTLSQSVENDQAGLYLTLKY